MTSRKFAVITGASTGIGYELASIAAAEGYDLLVVANEPLIQAAFADLQLHGGHVAAIEADLSTIAGVDALVAATAGRTIDVLCANAGAGHGGAFLNQAFEAVRMTIDTNVTGTLYLLHKVMIDMVARGQGKILVTGSIAGYVPGAFNAVYNATKAFIDNFTDALRNELLDAEGVTLTTLMPGATETAFFARADMLETAVGKSKKADPAKVAREGWDGLMAGDATVVPGLMNKAIVATSRLVPTAVLAGLHRKMAQPTDLE